MNANESNRTIPLSIASKIGSMRDITMPRFHLRHHIVALLIALIQGCAPEAVKPDPIPLPRGSWELVSATFAEHGRIPGAARATLAFENGRVSAFSGCNTANGTLAGGDGQLEVKELAVTRRGCPEPLAWFESRFFKMLRSTLSYHVDGEILVLTLGNDLARFRRVVP
jgi:heat shock protein HslJ